MNIEGHGIIDLMPSPDSPSTPNENIYHRPIIPLLFCFIAGLISARYIPGWYLFVVAISAPALIIFICRLFSKGLSRWSPLILFACLGYLSFSSIDIASSKTNHVAHFRDGRIWSITGTIASEPLVSKHRQKCILEKLTISPISGEGPTVEGLGNIQINIYGNGPVLAEGDRIMVTGKIKPISSFRNPGGFDYTCYMMWQNIWGTVSLSSGKLKILPSVDTNIFSTGLNAFRSDISGLIHQSVDGDAQGILSALIIGDRREISAALQEAFNRVGVSHVLSISGLHVGIVATAAFIFFKWLLSFYKPLLLRAWTKKGAAACAVFPVGLYGLIAGMEPATQRSVIMVSIFLMTFLIEREHDLFNTIAFAALAILIIDPPALFSISFQLSFAAVLSISWGMSDFSEKISQSAISRYKLAKYAATLFCVSSCAILGVSPLVMHYFNTFPISGFLANLIVVPLMGSLVVIIGLFSVLILYPFSSHAAVWGLKICGWILTPVLDFIFFVSDTSFAAIKTITPSILEIICFYLLAWGCIELYRKKKTVKEKEGNTNKNFMRRRTSSNLFNRWIGVLVTAVLLVLFADILYWSNRRLWNDDLRITVMDVGQGNAAVLEFPKGECMIIDGGGFGDNSAFDLGERVLAPFLWQHKIRTVDRVVLTHSDADHLNGLVFILKHFHVKQVISTHQPSNSAVYKDFVNLIQNNSINHHEFTQLQRSFAIHAATVEILHPDADFMERHASSSAKDINNNSIVLKAGFAGFSLLFPGDIMAAAEKHMVLKNPDALAADILISPHHGSKTSSSVAFLDAVDPEVIVISCGKENYFPSKTVFDRYVNRKIPVFRTDHNGAISVVIDKEAVSIEPMLGDKIIIRH